MKVLVTGATGYIGGRLVPRLREAGHEVICLVRDPSRTVGPTWEGVEIRTGDALDLLSLEPAFRGVDVAYHLIHSMAEGAHGFEDRDRVAAHNIAAAAKLAGVQRIIYLGGLGQGHLLSSHLASRQEVGEILRASGVAVTEFRAAIVVGSGSISFEMIRYLVERLPIMLVPRWVHVRVQPIGIRDVLEYLVRCLEEPRSIGRVLEIGGADVLTYAEMMLAYARIRGLRRRMIPVPVLTPLLSSYWVDLVTPIPAAFSHPLIEGLRSEVIVRDPIAREIFDFEPMSYMEAVRLALQRIETDTVETFWTSAAGTGTGRRPGFSLTTTEGMIVEQRRIPVPASPADVFAVFSGIGGRQGWLYADWAWKIRGVLDRLVGGVGLRRGRRSPSLLQVGEALDWWRVETIEAGQLLRLRAEMKVPGRAWLQFESQPRGAETLLVQTAFFEPRGLAGLAYWYLLYPIHQLIFSGMARAIAVRAAALSQRAPETQAPIIDLSSPATPP